VLGAIIGDIVGSIYERNNIKTKDFPFFSESGFFTDDTVMTVAVAEAVMDGGSKGNFINSMKKWGRLYPDSGYGGSFRRWLFSNDRKPYNSWGNGSAMRVSPCGWNLDCGFYSRTGCWPSNGWEVVRSSAAVTHNHPEGIKGAEAVAVAIFMCRFYFDGWEFDNGNGDCCTPEKWKAEIRRVIELNFGYDLSRTLDEIRPTYKFYGSCQETVPEAIIAFLESTDFEDAIRNAISIGGDSDTLAAITGSIAEAAYGIPDWIKNKALDYLDKPLLEVYERWSNWSGRKQADN